MVLSHEFSSLSLSSRWHLPSWECKYEARLFKWLPHRCQSDFTLARYAEDLPSPFSLLHQRFIPCVTSYRLDEVTHIHANARTRTHTHMHTHCTLDNRSLYAAAVTGPGRRPLQLPAHTWLLTRSICLGYFPASDFLFPEASLSVGPTTFASTCRSCGCVIGQPGLIPLLADAKRS